MPARKKMTTLPFAGTVSDSLGLMRRVWGAAGMPAPAALAQFAAGLPGALPSMITPTLDIAELDRRIGDLRAVEQWLELNAQLLRTSIQTLEVQRNTIATLKSLGSAMTAAGSADKSSAAALAQMQGAASTLPPGSFRAPGSAGAFVVAPPTGRAAARGTRGAAATAPAPTAIEAPFSPSAWWNTLQEQFNRVAAAAAADAAAASAASAASTRRPRKSAAPRKRVKASAGKS